MNIGEAASATGVSAKMIRYYESIGLTGENARSTAGYRKYSANDLHALRFIKQGRRLGFSLEQIRELLSLWQDSERASKDVKALAMTHVEELNQRIQEMSEMRNTLLQLAQACAGDRYPNCPILTSLAAP